MLIRPRRGGAPMSAAATTRGYKTQTHNASILRAILSDGTRRQGTRRCMDSIRGITVGNLSSASLGRTDDALVSERISASEEVVLF